MCIRKLGRSKSFFVSAVITMVLGACITPSQTPTLAPTLVPPTPIVPVKVNCEAEWQKDKTPESDGLTLLLNLEKSQYELREPKFPTLTLVNTGPIPVWVNNRMNVTNPWPEDAGEVYYVIISPWGETAELTAKDGDRHLFENDDFILLAPRQAYETISYEGFISYGFISTMTEDTNVEPYGKYCAWAIYHNQSDPGLYGIVWKGEIKSNFIEFEIVE